MSNEVSVRTSLQISNSPLIYQSQPTTFQADQTGKNGPTPGAILVAVTGTDVDLSQLTTPGFCWMMNLDSTNFVEYGIHDVSTGTFYPLGELLPGEIAILRLSRWLGGEYAEPGMGTAGSLTGSKLCFRADTAACRVRVEAFEK